jgi:hypothetical protein
VAYDIQFTVSQVNTSVLLDLFVLYFFVCLSSVLSFINLILILTICKSVTLEDSD